jgi:pimeloyl-ACP methyl ester carboxylesterase
VKLTANMDAKGTFSSRVTIGKDFATGIHPVYVELNLDPSLMHWSYAIADAPSLLVKETKGEKLSLDVSTDKEFYSTAKDTVTITGQVTASDGNVEGTTVTIQIMTPEGKSYADYVRVDKKGEYLYKTAPAFRFYGEVSVGEWTVKARAWKPGYLDGHASKPFVIGAKIMLEIKDGVEAAAADGASKLTLVATVTAGGKPYAGKPLEVKFECFSKFRSCYGGFSPESGLTDSNGRIEVVYQAPYGLSNEAWRDPIELYVLGSVAFDRVTITARAYDEDQNLAAHGEKEILLVPPPVLLVHGVAAAATTWQQAPSFELELKLKGFVVWLADYDCNEDITHSGDVSLPASIDLVTKSARDGRLYEVSIERSGPARPVKVSVAKVDIVAHSMGGLVARWYTTSEDYRHDVRKLIMLGTPNHGSQVLWLADSLGFKGSQWMMELATFLGLGAQAAPGKAWEQLEMNSDFILELNSRGVNYYEVEHLVFAGTGGAGIAGPLFLPVHAAFRAKWGQTDGVVPLRSASLVEFGVPLIVTNNHHNDMTTGSDGLFDDVYLNLRYHIMTGVKMTSVRARSPVALYCYDSSGQLVPIDVDGDMEKGLPVAYYWEGEDAKSLLIFNAEGEYRIVARGYDQGSLNFTITKNEEGESVYVSFENTPVREDSIASIDVSGQTQYRMDVDLDGDGTTDQTLSPTTLETEFEPPTTETMTATTPEAAESVLGLGLLLAPLVVAVVAVVLVRRRRARRGMTVQVAEKPARYCTECGAPIPVDATFCERCGQQVG